MTKEMRPSDIYYTQYSILEYFKNGHSIQSTSEDIKNGKLSINDLPKIRVFYEQEKCHQWMSLDNRRLWVFKQLELARFLEKISVETVQPDPAELNRKFTTTNCGTSIRIRKRKPWIPCLRAVPYTAEDDADYEEIVIVYEYEPEQLDGYDSEKEEVIPALKTYRQSCQSRTSKFSKKSTHRLYFTL